MKYKCVCFDFDGTLADAEGQVFRLYNEMAGKYKYKKITHEELQNIKEMNFSEVMEVIDIPFYRIPRILHEGKKRLKSEQHDIRTFDHNLLAFMEELSGYTTICGILTSNMTRTVKMFLEDQKIASYFDFVVCSSLLSKQKKIHKVCKKYKISPREMLYVGDETRDVEACHQAGVDVVAVDWGYNTKAALARCHPTYEVDTMDDIITIVKEKNRE